MGFEENRRVALAPVEDRSGLQRQFATALSEALTGQGLGLSPEARLIADFSVAQSAASAGIVRGEGATGPDAVDEDWLTAPREKRRFDKCEAQRLKATLVLYNRTDGSVAYRGSGEAIECAFDEADLKQFAQALVVDALAPAGR